jgi:6-phosphofructokinase 1
MISNKPIIGILTGGGDVPGLNAVIKSIVYRAHEIGYQVIGIRRGWMGLTHMKPALNECDPEHLMPLDRLNTRTIDRTGGTILHTSRTNPRKMKIKDLPDHFKKRADSLKTIGEGVFDLTEQVLENLQALKVNTLIAIGGDDTLSYASVLNQHGFPVIAIPKTMDNDVRSTEYCIGFATAVTRAMEAIERQRTTVASHERIGVFRIFGRDAGFTALYTAYVTSTRCLIPEYPFDLDHLATLLMKDKRSNPSRYALVIISEGATWEGRSVQEYGTSDAFGHKKKVNIGEALSDELKRITGEETIVSDLTYDLRSGAPDFMDRLISTTYANMAMDLIHEGQRGHMMAIQEGRYISTQIPEPSAGPRKVDVKTLYNTERLRPNYASKMGLPIFLERA